MVRGGMRGLSQGGSDSSGGLAGGQGGAPAVQETWLRPKMEPGGRTSRVLELLEPQQEARAKPVAWCAAGAGPTLRTEPVGQGTFGRNQQGIPQGRSWQGIAQGRRQHQCREPVWRRQDKELEWSWHHGKELRRCRQGKELGWSWHPG